MTGTEPYPTSDAPPGAQRFRPRPGDLVPPAEPAARVRANLEALLVLQALQDRAGQRATAFQQRILSRWSGWSRQAGEALLPAGHSATATTAQRRQIAGLLGPAGRIAARNDVANAYSTDPAIVAVVWSAVRRLGFDGGVVLEPGCGTGNFIGLAPPTARMIGVEVDPITATIGRHLYPDAQIRNASFTDPTLRLDRVDAVVGNVPAGLPAPLYPLHAPANRYSVHDRFLLKALQVTRPGGIVALITPRYTMDAELDMSRRAMAARADLITAVRLPDLAHQRTGDPSTGTDLLILRRRETSTAEGAAWVDTVPVSVHGHRLRINTYFRDHPQCALGELTTRTHVTGRVELAVTGDPNPIPALSRVLAGATSAPSTTAHPARPQVHAGRPGPPPPPPTPSPPPPRAAPRR